MGLRESARVNKESHKDKDVHDSEEIKYNKYQRHARKQRYL